MSEGLLGGMDPHPAQAGYDPRTYPSLGGKPKKAPQAPVPSERMNCKAEWERIRAEDPWPDELGYTI